MKLSHAAFLVSSFSILTIAASAAPVVSVSQPANNSTVASPVHYVASASSPQCAGGISAMRIYTAPHVSAYTVNSNHLDTNITLSPGTYNTVVQAWDNCGGVGKTAVNITVSASQLPAAKFLYSSDFNGGKVRGYLVNAASGALQPTGQAPAAAHTQPTRVAADKGGYRLYVVNQGSKNLDAYFIYRNNGYIYPVPGSPFAIGETPTAVQVHPSGKFVYVTAGNSVYAFAVQSDGSLKPVAGSPFSTSAGPEALALDPQGTYLYVSTYPILTSGNVNQIDAFSINPVDGTLTPVPGSPYTEPTSSFCSNGAWDIAVHPSGKFLVVPNMCEGIVVYSIERSTGTLTLVSGSPFPVPYPPGPPVQSIAMDPAGQYFWISAQYCHSGCSQTTDTWSFNASTGVPTYRESGESACGLLTRADPSGKFLFVVGDTAGSGCAGSNESPGIWGVSINRSNGSVTNIPGSPWASPNSDWFLTDGLAITP